ncbi:unnamed protein product [Didymodactylos carnosus]|uniref:Uncharacterized protein n=1 Tax=Didymodactylos carnosus TaxID=1234261 RepID=A0A814Z1H8_9BILA|nr:unnamed protein product [Didymodactylos carnosus]CAF3998879.1 unnamed protein product [Didymodactylos carnosus]
MRITDDDRLFFQQWKQTTLPFEKWTHKAHLLVSFIIVNEHLGDKNAIYKEMKEGIERFNSIHKEKLKVGFHETITRFWLNQMELSVEKHKEENNLDFEEFLNKEKHLLDTRLMFEYYSKELLFSEQAKKTFVSPDLK